MEVAANILLVVEQMVIYYRDVKKFNFIYGMGYLVLSENITYNYWVEMKENKRTV